MNIDWDCQFENISYRSFFLNFLTASHNGKTIHKNIMPSVKSIPVLLPKKSLYRALVNPINALTSIFNTTNILPRSIGFNAANRRVIFSSG